MKNKYVIRSRITEAKFRQIIKLFSLDIEASKVAKLVGVSRQSINKLFLAIRIRIAEYCEAESPIDKGEIEVDESYFGPRRVKGLRGRGAARKTPVFGLLKRGGKVYTEVIEDCSKATLEAIIQGKATSECTVHSDYWKGYDGLVDLGFKKHYRIRHQDSQFAQGPTHINGIESFWSYAKTRLTQFRGIHRRLFYLHLKETEFRFNYRKVDLYPFLLKIFLKHPLKLS
jgi:transposase-like protein